MSNKPARGKRSNTRRMMRNRAGKLSVNRILSKFEEGDKVLIKINSSHHSGLPSKRYNGIHGIVTAKQGESYVVNVKKQNKAAVVVTKPAHLRLVKIQKNEVATQDEKSVVSTQKNEAKVKA